MLAAAADFLTGPASPAPPPPPPPMPSPSTGGAASSHSKSHPSHQGGGIDADALRSVQVGEDSYFLRSDSLGVADGVGGWATRPGANPAMFSRLLMHFCSVELSRHDDVLRRRREGHSGSPDIEAQLQKFWDVDPVEVMHRAWERCVRVARREGILGSSTALLAMLRGNELRIANLGDCVLLIVRRGHLLFRSQEQQHSFNFPVQLGMMIKRGSHGRDMERLSAAVDAAAEESATADENEDLDRPEDEAKILEHRRKLQAHAGQMGDESAKFEQQERQREIEEKRRRAEFEGKDMAEFEAELEAAKEFDFDVDSPGASSRATQQGYGHQQQQQQRDRDEEDEDDEDGGRHTVYVGFNDAHPWDEPRRDCGRWTIRVQKGDIIIVASDGLVDNLFDDDIMEEVTRFAPPTSEASQEADSTHGSDSGIDFSHHENGTAAQGSSASQGSAQAYPPGDFSPQLLSEALCSRAKAISQDSKAIISPFQQRATEEGLHYVGGKHDDISVLVAVVGEASTSSSEGAGAGAAGGGGAALELRG